MMRERSDEKGMLEEIGKEGKKGEGKKDEVNMGSNWLGKDILYV